MNLLIDIGNTTVKWRLYNGKNIIVKNQCFTKDFLCEKLPSDKQILATLVSNVNHDSYAQMIQVWGQKHSLNVIFLEQKTHPNLQNHYQDKARLGVDRWLNALGAWQHYNQSVFIISAGTAITVDYVESRENELPVYEGGMILPGISAALKSLNQATAKINANLNHHAHFPAKTTDDSVTTGITFALMGAVNLACRTQSAEAPIILTGGDADLLVSHADDAWQERIRVHEDLIFDGMLAYL